MDLSRNLIETIDPETFFFLENLRELILNFNMIIYVHSGIFKNLVKLNELDLSNNKIQFIEKNEFKFLENLKVLNLKSNSLRNLNVDIFQDLKKIENIYLKGKNRSNFVSIIR